VRPRSFHLPADVPFVGDELGTPPPGFRSHPSLPHKLKLELVCATLPHCAAKTRAPPSRSSFLLPFVIFVGFAPTSFRVVLPGPESVFDFIILALVRGCFCSVSDICKILFRCFPFSPFPLLPSPPQIGRFMMAYSHSIPISTPSKVHLQTLSAFPPPSLEFRFFLLTTSSSLPRFRRSEFLAFPEFFSLPLSVFFFLRHPFWIVSTYGFGSPLKNNLVCSFAAARTGVQGPRFMSHFPLASGGLDGYPLRPFRF